MRLHSQRTGRGGILLACLLLVASADCSSDVPSQKPVLSDQERAEVAFQKAEELRRSWETASERQALDRYQEALEIWTRLGSKPEIAAAFRGLGKTRLQLGEARQALDSLDQALTLYRELQDNAQQAAVLNDIGRAFTYLGRSQETFNSHQEALRLTQDSAPLEKALALRYLAAQFDAWGEIEKAVDQHEKAIAILRDLGQMDRLAGSLRQAARTYSQLGRMEEATQCLEEALAIRREQNLIQHQSGILTEIGWNHHLLGEHRQAIDTMLEAIQLNRANGFPAHSGALDRLGSAYREAGELEKALGTYQQALKAIEDEGGSAISRAHTLLNLADLHLKTGEPETTLQLCSEAMPVFRPGQDVQVLAHIHFLAAMAERDRGNFGAAQDRLDEALEIIQSVRYRVTRHALIDAYQSSNYLYYEAYVDLLMRRHQRQPEAGFDRLALVASEQTRARRLEEALTASSEKVMPLSDPNLVQRRRQLLEQIEALDRQRVELVHSARPPSEIRALDAEQQKVFLELDRLMAQGSRDERPQPSALDLKQVQGLLPDDTWLLYYFLGRERSYLWVLSQDSIDSFPLEPAPQIEASARKVHELFNQKQTPSVDHQIDLYLSKLGEKLLSPLSAGLSNQRLIVAADASLHYVPFGALSDSQGRRLIEQHEIEHLPSAATLTLLQKASPSSFAAGGDLALFADPVFHRLDPRLAASSVSDASPGQDSQEPMEDADVLRSARDLGMARLPRLPYTRQEGEAILKLWSPENGFQAFDFRANRQQLLQLDLSRFRVLHFATHALLHPRYPDLSGVVLSLVDQNGQPQAGFLRAHEIAGLNLNADLVVLSACQTAMGKEVPGEGMIGLPQSFLDAGVPRVVVSLWNVSDPATAHLMHRFYSGMRENNLRPSAALRRAQLSLLEGERWHSPYYWAPFIYLGRHDP